MKTLIIFLICATPCFAYYPLPHPIPKIEYADNKVLEHIIYEINEAKRLHYLSDIKEAIDYLNAIIDNKKRITVEDVKHFDYLYNWGKGTHLHKEIRNASISNNAN